VEFDKRSFVEYLNKARGDRSINKYAEECGVSAAHISRLLREMIDTPPNPDIIKKFTDHAHNGVTYGQLMQAAGHSDIVSVEYKIMERKIQLVYYQDMLTKKRQEIAAVTHILSKCNESDLHGKEHLSAQMAKLEKELSVLESNILTFSYEIEALKEVEVALKENLNLVNEDDVIDEDIKVIARGMQKLKEENPENFDLVKRLLKTMSDKADDELNK